MTNKLIIILFVVQVGFTVACGDGVNRELPKVDPATEQMPEGNFTPDFPENGKTLENNVD